MLCSMSGEGDCWREAPTESYFDFPTHYRARVDVVQYVEGPKNRPRLHSELGCIAPQQTGHLATAVHGLNSTRLSGEAHNQNDLGASRVDPSGGP